MSGTSYYSPLQNKAEIKTDYILGICRLFVGVLFIFSGLIKANDPMGFGYKLEEYFHVFHLSILNDYSAYIAIAICAVEIILGILLLLGIARNSVAWGLLLLIVFFTFLTFYSAFFDVVTSCGCFGDAIPLTPWQSFGKDIILLILILIIFRKRKNIKPLFESSFANNVLILLTILLSFGFGIYTFKYLPIIDFLPYKTGNHIPSLMKVPEGAAQDVFQHIYTLKNKSNGETKKVTDKEYMAQKIWEDENWEIIGEPETTLLQKGYEVPIPDLVITDNEGNNYTSEIIENPHYNFIITSVDVSKFTPADFIAMDKINQTIKSLSNDYNVRAILLTASATKDVDYLNDQLDLVLENFYADAVPIKSMVRSNPGILLLQNGTVIMKWSKVNFPSKEILTAKYLK